MIKYFLIFLILNSWILVCAQDNEVIDSLERELQFEKTDTNKVKLYCSLSSTYYTSNKKKALNYINKAIELAKAEKWDKGIGNGLLIRGKIYDNSKESYKDFNNAISYFEKQNESVLIGKGYDYKASYFTHNSMIDSSIYFSKKAISILRKNKDSLQLSVALNTLGSTYIENGDFDNAVITYEELVKISNKINNLKITSRAEGGLANIYLMTGNTSKAVYHIRKAHDIYITTGNVLGAAKYLKYLAAEEYTLDSNLTQAMERLHESLNVFKQNKIYYMTAEIAYEMGMLYSENNILDSAKKYLNYSSKDGLISEDGRSMILGFLAKGTYYDLMGDSKKSEDSYIKALDYTRETNFN